MRCRSISSSDCSVSPPEGGTSPPIKEARLGGRNYKNRNVFANFNCRPYLIKPITGTRRLRFWNLGGALSVAVLQDLDPPPDGQRRLQTRTPTHGRTITQYSGTSVVLGRFENERRVERVSGSAQSFGMVSPWQYRERTLIWPLKVQVRWSKACCWSDTRLDVYHSKNRFFTLTEARTYWI